MVTLSNAPAITVSLPQNSAAAFPVGAEVDFLWLGAGQPTFAAGTGATVNGTPGLKLRAQYSRGHGEEDLHQRVGHHRGPECLMGVPVSIVASAVLDGMSTAPSR